MLKVGGLHPILLPHYGSDYEWTARAARKGFKIHTFEDLNYKFSTSTTGNNDYETATWKKIFSKRSTMNPFYKTVSMLMITPPKYWGHEFCAQIMRWGYRVVYLMKGKFA